MLDFVVSHQRDVLFATMFGGMALLLLLEQVFPRRSESGSQNTRWLNNLSVTLLNFFVLTYVMIAISSSQWIASIQPATPLLQTLELSPWMAVVVTILVMDFVGYWFHRLMHTVPWFWRVHSVHHYDTEVDVTTTHRHHPIEPILVLAINIPVIIFLGPPILALVLYNLLHVVVATLSHSNIYMPKIVDRWLRLLLVTPDFHRLHHMSQQVFTDSNYGAIFPWFDHMFGSASNLPFEQHKSIELGLSYFRKSVDSRLDRLLLAPFRRK